MKKVLSMVLVAVMAAAMGVSAFAASTAKYTGMVKALGYSYSGVNNDTLDLGEIYAHSEVKVELPLYSEMFAVADGATQPAPGELLSATSIRTSKIAVRTQISAGSKAVKEVSIDNRKGLVVIKFVDEWVSTKEQDFEVYAYLTINGKRQNDLGLTVIGTMTNPEIEVYSGDDYVDLSDGMVADAQEFVNNIEVDLGNGVTIYTKFFKNKKYYGTATRSIDQAADVVMRQYPDIDNIVTLKTVGLNSTGDIVRLDTDYTDYYVYDKDLNYVGQSSEKLPYSSTYYLANKKLDIEDESEEPEEEEPEEEYGTNPGTGGDGSSSNANANPGTGR